MNILDIFVGKHENNPIPALLLNATQSMFDLAFEKTKNNSRDVELILGGFKMFD